MRIFVRAMVNKSGSYNYVLFNEGDGIDNPIAILHSSHMAELVDMYHDEQTAMDKYILGRGESDE